MGERTAFVTGGTGFLGSHLAKRLCERGWRVAALYRPHSDISRLKALGVELRLGDITDRDSLLRAMPEGVEAVFHAAAAVSLWSGHAPLLERVNVLGTRNMVSVAIEKKIGRFIHTSSTSVYGNVPGRTMDEMAPHLGLASRVAYLRTKAQAEIEVQGGLDRGLDAVILQPTYMLGRYDANNWGRLFRMLRDGKMGGVPKGAGSFVDARAVAAAHLSAMDKGKTGSRYILSTTPATYRELFTVAARLLGLPKAPGPVPAILVSAMAWISQGISLATQRAPDLTPEVAFLLNHSFFYDGRKAIDELGVETADIGSMLGDCYAWLKAEGKI